MDSGYPNLSAAIAVYHFCRDWDYGIGTLGLGIAAYCSGSVDAAFWFVVVAMFFSDSLLLLSDRPKTVKL